MNNDKLREWAELVYLYPELKIREPGSKPQKQIRLIQSLVTEARVNPSKEVYDSLKNTYHAECSTSCKGTSTFVSYCRYLQHTISKLDIHFNEGKTVEP